MQLKQIQFGSVCYITSGKGCYCKTTELKQEKSNLLLSVCYAAKHTGQGCIGVLSDF